MSSLFASRSAGEELMDDLNCSGEVVNQTLRELEFINRTLGGNAITVNGVSQLLGRVSTKNPELIDLGCGGGDMLVLLNQKFKSTYPGIKFQGIDANPNIIQYASDHVREDNISFADINIFSSEFSRLKCDVATATLFLHHFTADQLVEILKILKANCRIGIVINDLHRHPLAFYSIKLLTKFFSKSDMVKYDAPLSVLRGFKKSEWQEILKRAGISNYAIQWKWAFRWQIVIWNK